MPQDVGPWTRYQNAPPATSTEEEGPWTRYQQQNAPTPDAVAAPTPQVSIPKAFQNYVDQAVDAPPTDTGWRGAVERVGQRAMKSFTAPLVHPLDTINGMAQIPTEPWKPIANEVKSVRGDYQQGGIPRVLENAAGDAAGAALQGGILGAAAEVPGMARGIRTAAIGDPDVAALRGLGVGPTSPKSLGTLRSVQGARPYLAGAKSLEDLQAKVPLAKNEIWAPYQQAIEGIGERPIRGPEGMTTVRQLEADRAQNSALLRDLKSQNPEAVQLAQQKGLTQADLLAREKSIHAMLDPELEATGIDPKGIRKTFGNVAQVGGRISGKSTLAERPQPYGFGKMADMKLGTPRTWAGSLVQGGRDLVAGRPLWRGSPTDINLREAFRTGGEKPNLGTFTPPAVRGFLPSPWADIPLGEAPGPGEMPGALIDAERFPAQNVGEARVIRNAQGQILPKALRKVEFPDESGKLPFGRNPKGQILSRTPTRKAFMSGNEGELPPAPPISGPGVLRRRKP